MPSRCHLLWNEKFLYIVPAGPVATLAGCVWCFVTGKPKNDAKDAGGSLSGRLPAPTCGSVYRLVWGTVRKGSFENVIGVFGTLSFSRNYHNSILFKLQVVFCFFCAVFFKACTFCLSFSLKCTSFLTFHEKIFGKNFRRNPLCFEGKMIRFRVKSPMNLLFLTILRPFACLSTPG